MLLFFSCLLFGVYSENMACTQLKDALFMIQNSSLYACTTRENGMHIDHLISDTMEKIC